MKKHRNNASRNTGNTNRNARDINGPQGADGADEKPLKGRTIAVMVANGFDEADFTGAQKRLFELGATVKAVARANGLVNGWYDGGWGHFFPVDADLADTLAVDFDGLVIPGGIRSVEKMAEDPHATRVLKAFMRAGMPVATLGEGVRLLVASEDAAGLTVTGAASVRASLEEAGAMWAEGPVQVSGALVTAALRGEDAGADASADADENAAENQTMAQVMAETMAEFCRIVVAYDPESTLAA